MSTSSPSSAGITCLRVPDLKYGGIAPTGDLPKAVNFPMAKSKATARTDQSCPIASDTQAYDMTEIGYARDGAVSDLAQREDYGGCGVLLLGDNVGDDLSLNPALKDIYRDTNGPIRAVLGNHDMDFDAPNQSHMADTFRNDFGPTSFSYDVGEIHFVVLNSISTRCRRAVIASTTRRSPPSTCSGWRMILRMWRRTSRS